MYNESTLIIHSSLCIIHFTLTFRELEPTAGFFPTGFFAFYHARIPRQEAFFFEGRAELCVQFNQRAGNCHAGSFGLTSHTTTANVDLHVVATSTVDSCKRLVQNNLQNFGWEVLFVIFPVHRDGSAARRHVDPGDGSFTAANGIDTIHDDLEFNCCGLLSLVGVLTACVNVQVRVQPPTEPVLGQHAFYGVFDDALRVLFEQQPGRCKPLTTGIARMANIYFVGHLRAGQAHLVGIDDDYVISAVNVRSEAGFVFAANQACDLACQSAKHFTLSVNHNPFLLHGRFVGRDGFVTERIHCYGD